VNENNTKGNVTPLLLVPLRLYNRKEIIQLSRNTLGVMAHHRSHGPKVLSVSTYIDCADIAVVALQQGLGVMAQHRSHGPKVWSVSTYIDCAETAVVALQQRLTCDVLLNSRLVKMRTGRAATQIFTFIPSFENTPIVKG
jgi:hypothetical protein